MAASSDFLPFATNSGANVTSQDDWESDSTVGNGFSSGLASSAKFNKALRQATFGVAALAGWIATKLGVAVADDGVLANFETQLGNAIAAAAKTGNYAGVTVSSATSLALTAANSGYFYEFNGTSAATWTLPAASGNGGLCFGIYNAGSATLTLGTAGGSIVNGAPTVRPGVATELVSDGTNWVVQAGAGSGSFASSGYQKLPSGLIIQWGSFSIPSGANRTNVAVTFPIQFPSAVLNVTGNGTTASNGTTWGPVSIMPSASTFTTSGCTVICDTANSSQNFTSGVTGNYLAIGY